MAKSSKDNPTALPQASLEILLTLAGREQHGYGIKHAVEERTGGAVRLGAGTLYAALQRLEDQGLIEEIDERPDPDLGSSRWRFYTLTEDGRDRLKADLERLSRTVSLARALDLLPEGEA